MVAATVGQVVGVDERADTMSAKKYLVVRLGAMGDVLHAMPAVAALRHADPGPGTAGHQSAAQGL